MNVDAQAQLEKILSKRKRWVEANRENGFEEGILRLLSDLYPDQAHFIYELLQNAEDAGASAVTFHLERSVFSCQHNGKRMFNLADVDSITSIGKSTKREDINQIGKFGVGFKAVFSYTNTPSVFSGDYAFEIRDLVCPHPVSQSQQTDSATLFSFPFNRREKPRAACFEEIAQTLCSLSENTLMFLDNIKEIHWSIADQGEGSVRTVDHGASLLQIEHRAAKKRPVSTYWLRFQESYDSKRRLRVATAFALVFRDQDAKSYDPQKSIKEQFKIVPTEGRLCIFFPADRETTKLKFHIHGPYASTVDRASIPHGTQNKGLVETTGQLVAAALLSVKDLGLLDRDFLAVLPNMSDEIDAFYEPVQDAITAAMRANPLVPTDSGGHERSTELIQSPRAIRALLGVERLKFFLVDETTRWAIGCMQNSREDQFLRSLSIRDWAWDDFIESLCERFENAGKGELTKNVDWLAGQDDKWMASFYGMLCRALDGDDIHAYQIRDCRIVRLDDGSHVKGRDAFFPDPAKRDELSGLPTVKKALLQAAKNKDADRTRRFLEEIDVKVIDEEQEIRLILQKWYVQGTDCPDNEEHLKHMRRFIEYVQKQKAWQAGTAAGIFRECCIFQDSTEEHFRTPSAFILDSPFADTGLSGLADKKISGFADKHHLWTGYVPLLEHGFAAFAGAVGVSTRLPIQKISTWKNPDSSHLHEDYYRGRRSEYEINDDYTIPNLDDLLSARDTRILRVVWATMCAADKAVLVAKYRPNSRYETRKADSVLVHELRKQKWVPARDGKFYRPRDVAQDNLIDGFPYNDTNGWLNAIHFGASIVRKTEDYKRKLSTLQSIGIPPDFLDEWERLTGEERAEIGTNLTDFLRKQAKSRLDGGDLEALDVKDYGKGLEEALSKSQSRTGRPDTRKDESHVPDPERRRDREEERLDEDLTSEPSPGERFQILPRKVWDRKRAEVRVFLEQQYGGRCQICDAGFKKRSGDPYFVALYLVPHISAKWAERPGNVLCVCANCAAKLQHGAVEANGIEEHILARKLAREGGGEPLQLPLKLCGEEKHITFTERHFLALQEIVKKSREPAVPVQQDPQLNTAITAKGPPPPTHPMTTCTVCGCAVRKDRLERHLQKAHKKSKGSQRSTVRVAHYNTSSTTKVGRCSACGKPAIPGSDRCYNCM